MAAEGVPSARATPRISCGMAKPTGTPKGAFKAAGHSAQCARPRPGRARRQDPEETARVRWRRRRSALTFQCSPLGRTRETLAIARRELGLPTRAATSTSRLTEFDLRALGRPDLAAGQRRRARPRPGPRTATNGISPRRRRSYADAGAASRAMAGRDSGARASCLAWRRRPRADGDDRRSRRRARAASPISGRVGCWCLPGRAFDWI